MYACMLDTRVGGCVPISLRRAFTVKFQFQGQSGGVKLKTWTGLYTFVVCSWVSASGNDSRTSKTLS